MYDCEEGYSFSLHRQCWHTNCSTLAKRGNILGFFALFRFFPFFLPFPLFNVQIENVHKTGGQKDTRLFEQAIERCFCFSLSLSSKYILHSAMGKEKWPRLESSGVVLKFVPPLICVSLPPGLERVLSTGSVSKKTCPLINTTRCLRCL